MDVDNENQLALYSNFYDKELSWLSFNERVLQEAADKSVPLIQRVRYLGIFSNNLDEFYRVRVANVSRMAAFSKGESKNEYRDLLANIQKRTKKIQNVYNRITSEVIASLGERKIYLVNEHQLDSHQKKQVSAIFSRVVLPELQPVIIDGPGQFPEINDGSIYLAIKITDHEGAFRYAILGVPTNRLPRFIKIPQKADQKGCTVFIVLENIIRHDLHKVFRGAFSIKHVEAYQFKITRDANLDVDEAIDQSVVNRMANSLKKRKNAALERLVFDASITPDLLDFLRKELGLTKYDSVMPGGRYHSTKDYMSFPGVGPAYLQFRPMDTLPPPERVEGSENIFTSIRNKDILVYYPYHSFNTVINFLQTAAIDPDVLEIRICLYRAASKSKVIDALISAKRNRKRVTAVVELQARFDEAANIGWSRALTDAGVNVIFGVPGLKVHSKLLLVSRKEGSSIKYYSHVGTGNFNEKTANIYTDFGLLTYDQVIGSDIDKVFDFIHFNYRHHEYSKILVSPHTNRSGLMQLVEREIDHAKAGIEAEISIKCNNIVDPAFVIALTRASVAGVRVRIICRGMLSMVTGVPGITENVEAISIVDRFLEHPRFFIFGNAGDPEYYISSADLMSRNLDNRVEVTAPIADPDHKKTIQDIFDIQWCDNVKARIIDAKQTNQFRKSGRGEKVRSQEAIHTYLKSGRIPNSVLRAKKRWAKELSKKAKTNKRD